MVSAIVLAAGLSSRMGKENKLLLPWKNKTIIETVTDALLKANLEEIIVVTGHEATKIKSLFKNTPVKIIENQNYINGLTTSIQCGVGYAKGNGYMLCLADMININANEYSLLKESFEIQYRQTEKGIVLPRFKNEKGNPVIFSSYYKQTILNHKNRNGCKEIINANQEHISWVDMDTDHVLLDIDYPEDYYAHQKK